jgi:UDP-N-acetylmuramate-alanine ligase
VHLADKTYALVKEVLCLNGFDEAIHYLRQKIKPGDVLITMGAGDVHIVGERLLHT